VLRCPPLAFPAPRILLHEVATNHLQQVDVDVLPVRPQHVVRLHALGQVSRIHAGRANARRAARTRARRLGRRRARRPRARLCVVLARQDGGGGRAAREALEHLACEPSGGHRGFC
jgi:hypothetical protein